ncbi:hypothetical protein D3C72_2024120 [compost metagenome]|jgi:hypothetical protein
MMKSFMLVEALPTRRWHPGLALRLAFEILSRQHFICSQTPFPGASGRGVDYPTIRAVTERPRRDRSGGQEAKDLGPIVRRQDDVLIFLVVARNTEALAPAGFAVGVVGVVDIHLQTALRVLE